ncbi:MAG: sugar ABC transporter permease [Candidatus Bipolaricaulota bacterium]
MRVRSYVPWMYLAPALAILGFFLLYPTVTTVVLSFYGARGDQFVGLANYVRAFSSPEMITAYRNNLLWLIVFTLFTVSLGLVLAVLTDRVRYERLVKTAVFLPMAVSFVGAGVIWKFMYAWRPPFAGQIGLLNAIIVALGGQPVGWLIARPWINNLALIAVGIWIWTGFCTVVLSAAYKGIPKELLEAARIDGANEWYVFLRVILPLMAPTIAVVTITMVISVLKVFDIVYVMTNGFFDTEVIANRMYKEMFHFRNFGMAATLAVVLFMAILPFMVANVRRFRAQEERR